PAPPGTPAYALPDALPILPGRSLTKANLHPLPDLRCKSRQGLVPVLVGEARNVLGVRYLGQLVLGVVFPESARPQVHHAIGHIQDRKCKRLNSSHVSISYA